MTKCTTKTKYCDYNSNCGEYYEALSRWLVTKSTRSKKSEDAYRDMDDFDVDEELARLRRAIRAAKSLPPTEDTAELYNFIVDAFYNIDEHLRRQGNLPNAYVSSARETLYAEKERLEHMEGTLDSNGNIKVSAPAKGDIYDGLPEDAASIAFQESLKKEYYGSKMNVEDSLDSKAELTLSMLRDLRNRVEKIERVLEAQRANAEYVARRLNSDD